MTRAVDLPGRYGWREALVLPGEFFEAPTGGEAAQLGASASCASSVVAALATAILLLGSGSASTSTSGALTTSIRLASAAVATSSTSA